MWLASLCGQWNGLLCPGIPSPLSYGVDPSAAHAELETWLCSAVVSTAQIRRGLKALVPSEMTYTSMLQQQLVPGWCQINNYHVPPTFSEPVCRSSAHHQLWLRFFIRLHGSGCWPNTTAMCRLSASVADLSAGRLANTHVPIRPSGKNIMLNLPALLRRSS
jgi:hypothetical protein